MAQDVSAQAVSRRRTVLLYIVHSYAGGHGLAPRQPKRLRRRTWRPCGGTSASHGRSSHACAQGASHVFQERSSASALVAPRHWPCSPGGGALGTQLRVPSCRTGSSPGPRGGLALAKAHPEPCESYAQSSGGGHRSRLLAAFHQGATAGLLGPRARLHRLLHRPQLPELRGPDLGWGFGPGAFAGGFAAVRRPDLRGGEQALLRRACGRRLPVQAPGRWLAAHGADEPGCGLRPGLRASVGHPAAGDAVVGQRGLAGPREPGLRPHRRRLVPSPGERHLLGVLEHLQQPWGRLGALGGGGRRGSRGLARGVPVACVACHWDGTRALRSAPGQSGACRTTTSRRQTTSFSPGRRHGGSRTGRGGKRVELVLEWSGAAARGCQAVPGERAALRGPRWPAGLGRLLPVAPGLAAGAWWGLAAAGASRDRRALRKRCRWLHQ
mmetsp:Transcript_112766/g.364041  ORF Transcript_112766/g.364041 Transcript_112766/m.364041 type:complete len:439 (+) Transcript_112766:14-1330(+)